MYSSLSRRRGKHKNGLSATVSHAASFQARNTRFVEEPFFPRHYQSPSLEKTARYIEERLTAMGGRVSSQPFTADGKAFRNVVARYGPESGSVLVIGAHYDSHSTTPGADDNASGVAGLLELARLVNTPATKRYAL